MRHLQNHKSGVRGVILENTPGLASRPRAGGTGGSTNSSSSRGSGSGSGNSWQPSNLEWVAHKLRHEAHFHVKVFELTPTLFGVPQNRPRLWMLCFELGFVEQLQQRLGHQSIAEFDAWAAGIMQRMVGSQLAPLDHYLLPEAHPKVQQRLREISVRHLAKQGQTTESLLAAEGRWSGPYDAAAAQRTAAKSPKWAKAHWEEFGPQWCRMGKLDPMDAVLWPGLLELTPREMELLQAHEVNVSPQNFCRVGGVWFLGGASASVKRVLSSARCLFRRHRLAESLNAARHWGGRPRQRASPRPSLRPGASSAPVAAAFCWRTRSCDCNRRSSRKSKRACCNHFVLRY